MKETLQLKTKYILKAALFCLVFTGIFIAFSFLKSLVPANLERLAHGILGTSAAILTTFLFIKFDKQSFADIGLKFEKSTLSKFFIGLLFGIGIMTLLVLYVIYTADFKIGTNTNSNIFKFLLLTLPLIPLAFMEEVAFRAYPLTLLKNKIGISNAIIITSLLFAFYHIVNGWTLQNSFLGAGVWGMIYGLAAVYSNGISMPTGLHYGANLTTSAFGVSNTSFNIWTLTQKNGETLENYQGNTITALIPQLALLIIGIICLAWYLRKNNS